MHTESIFIVFFVFVFTSIGTEKGRIFIRGVPQPFGGEVAPNCPPGSATASNIVFKDVAPLVIFGPLCCDILATVLINVG